MLKQLLMYTFLTARPLSFDGPPIAMSYDDEDDIPSAFKVLYAEGDDGKWVLTNVAGLKTPKDFANVQEALRKERNDHRTLKTSIRSKLGDKYDLDDLVARAQKADDLQAELDAVGDPKDPKKLAALVDARAKALVGPVERERDDLKVKLAEAGSLISTFQTDSKTRKIHDAVRAAATKSKVVGDAVDDVLMYAERSFDVEEDGTVVTKDGQNPEAWLIGLQPKKSHWWGESSGGGAGGSRNKNNQSNPWLKANWNRTEQGQMVRSNPTLAAQLAKAAGVTVGAVKPAE